MLKADMTDEAMDVCLPVKSEGVKVEKLLFTISPTEKAPDLPDLTDIESTVIL
jgi:hypothetical protein